jgi:hypothetical protein
MDDEEFNLLDADYFVMVEYGNYSIGEVKLNIKKFIEMVKEIGDFPILTDFDGMYMTYGEQEPEPLIKECKELLHKIDPSPDLNEMLGKSPDEIKENKGYLSHISRFPQEKQKLILGTLAILYVAEGAIKTGSIVRVEE